MVEREEIKIDYSDQENIACKTKITFDKLVTFLYFLKVTRK